MHGCIYRSLRCWRSEVLGGWGVGGLGVFHFFSLRPQNRRPLATQARLHITDLTMTSFFIFIIIIIIIIVIIIIIIIIIIFIILIIHRLQCVCSATVTKNYLPLTYYLTRTTEEFGTYITIPFCFIISNLEWV